MSWFATFIKSTTFAAKVSFCKKNTFERSRGIFRETYFWAFQKKSSIKKRFQTQKRPKCLFCSVFPKLGGESWAVAAAAAAAAAMFETHFWVDWKLQLWVCCLRQSPACCLLSEPASQNFFSFSLKKLYLLCFRLLKSLFVFFTSNLYNDSLSYTNMSHFKAFWYIIASSKHLESQSHTRMLIIHFVG